jgi:hypothetical protein
MNDLQLRFREREWNQLASHLFPGDGDEHGAALLCGYARSEGVERLLVREIVPAVDGVDYVPGTRGYRHLTGGFVTHQLRRAKDLGLAYLAVHNHGGSTSVAFSGSDLDSHERAYPTLSQVSGGIVGGVVTARQALAADIWFPDGQRRHVSVTTVVGETHLRLTDGPGRDITPLTAGPLAPFARQTLVFGEYGQQLLGGMRVGVVGAGGVGMLIVQALARLGVGHFVVIDPDHISVSNLSRLPEAHPRDAHGWLGGGVIGRLGSKLGISRPTSKVALATRIVRHANRHATATAVVGDVADDRTARTLTGCDFIFLAADTMLARDVVNQLAYQYLIPTLQVGSKVIVDPKSKAVTDVYGVVRSLGSAAGCLRCNGLINVARLTEEAVATEQQRRNQRYVDDPEITAPSVITINAMSAGWAVNDFMHYATGLGRPSTGFRILRTRPARDGMPQLTVQTPDHDDSCHVCGNWMHSALGRGDTVDLPTRISAP